MMDICVYHRNDLDGKCSAAIVLHRYPEVELIPYNYGDEFDSEVCRGKKVVFVDCSLQPFQRLMDLGGICDLVVIDHHKTFIEAVEASDELTFRTLMSSKEAGCELTWRWCHDSLGRTMPRAVEMLGRYDRWDLGDGVMEFQYGARSLDLEPRSALWPRMLGDDYRLVDSIFEDGHAILGYVAQHNANLCKVASFEATLQTPNGDLRCICINSPLGNSQIFKSVWDPERHDAMLVFFKSNQDYWSVSLYTEKDINVGEYAKSMGGGGHEKAAGFQMDNRNLPPGITVDPLSLFKEFK